MTPHVEVGAYAIGSLESDEAASFEGHLDRCSRCREELVWLEWLVYTLTMTAPEDA